MMRGNRSATPEEMDAVVAAYDRLTQLGMLVDGWYGMDEKGLGPWGKKIGPKAIAGARKLFAGRPHLALMFTISPLNEGGIFMEARDSARASKGGPVLESFTCLEINRGGDIELYWDETEPDHPRGLSACPDNGLCGKSIGSRDVMKALDRLTRPRTGKILAHKPIVDGIRFDSELEARRYRDLKADPTVRDLRWQVPFAFEEDGKVIFRWVSDFIYRRGDGPEIVEDVKGMKTPLYRLKKKLIETRHGFKIQEWPEHQKKKRKPRSKN